MTEATAREGEAIVPREQIGESAIDAAVTRCYRRFKDWNKRGFSADDVTWCEVRADLIEIAQAMLAASPPPSAGGEVMKLHFTDDWLRQKIASDPDDASYEAGASHPEAPQQRFFVDHGVVHDRATGKHIRTCDCLKPHEDGIEQAVVLLNDMDRSHTSLQSEVERLTEQCRVNAAYKNDYEVEQRKRLSAEAEAAFLRREYAKSPHGEALAKARADVIEEAARVLSNKANSTQTEHNDALDDERYEPLDREITEGRIDGLKWAARIVRSLAHGGGA